MRWLPLALLAVCAAAPAQAPADTFGHSKHGGAFDEGPRRAARLMPGLSSQVHFEVNGLGDRAQSLFDQGVCQLHGFWYFEAERSFREVAKLHPDCAMAYWGMSMANVENKARAAEFAARAVQRSASAPRKEELWIDAVAKHYLVDDASRVELRSGDDERVTKAIAALGIANGDKARDEKKLGKQLIKDLESIVFEFPDDIEAKAFLAVQNWLTSDWGSGVPIVCHAGIDALLDQVFAKAPLHPAHHYRVHLWDQERAERALKSAAVLGDTAPGIAHQWHMAGHIYAKLDRHAEAAWQQEASARVDHAHMSHDRVMPFLIHNYGHNQEWLARSLSYFGRGHEALEVAKNLAEIPRHPKWNSLDDEDSIATDARARLASVCEDHEMWQEAIDLVATGHLDRSDSVCGEVQRLSLLCRAYYRLGRREDAERIAAEVEPLLVKARAERATAVDKAEDEALAKKSPRADAERAMGDAARHSTDVVRAVLDLRREITAERLLAVGDPKVAAAELEAVPGVPKTLLADAFVAAGEPQKAIEILEKELKERPRRVPAMVRLFAAYDFENKPENKEKVRDLMMLVTNVVGSHDSDLTATPLLARASIGVDSRPPARPRDPFDTSWFAGDFGKRPELASLGPHHWQPFAAPSFDLPDAVGGRHTLAQHHGRPTLVVFWLGMECPHCVAQLEELAKHADDFAGAGIDVIAIGNLPAGEAEFGFPLLHDAELRAFGSWQCHDDFEQLPLHGAFLVDGGGDVRWQDVGAEPFAKFEWLLAESRRLLALRSVAAAKTVAK